ncbi:SPFH domain-containing protein [Thalassospira sp.]|uniref:SPFH domain-containing protein n=1 Tax=Thalassospira sp. TaxID=1912094 RepID=UPI002734D1A1|nr:SPFH domain-containing protein [Thalassospira sp.]MDP2699974.1 SPFH domain-containing protein [Thalassospira sp.]
MADTRDTDNTASGPDIPATPTPKRFSLRRHVQRMLDGVARLIHRHSMSILITLFFIVIGMIVLAPRIFITIPAGHTGVLWYRFFGGTVIDRSFGEGIHMIFPWDEMYIYDARLQNNARIYDTISSNGLAMQVDIAVRYRINPDTAGMLHKLVGPNFPEILVYPEIGSQARELISRYTPEQLYTETRAFIQAEILERMVNELGSSLINQSFQGRMVTVEDVLIRSVTLPERVAEAIERKAEQYQAMLEYDFRIAREEKEKERKRIEAEGIREFQDIVARTITGEYLKLRGIEATMALATSRNSKTIIIGGKDGLPVILNTGPDEPQPATDAELTEDSRAPAANPTEMNARLRDIAPQNAVSPGVDGARMTPVRPATDQNPSSSLPQVPVPLTDAAQGDTPALPEHQRTLNESEATPAPRAPQ